jgi:HPt (histidine-containing phosphotransfer) domain-containing protein
VNPPSGPNGSAAKKAAAPAPAAEVEVLDLGVLEEMGIVPGSGPGSVAASIITIFLREERPRVEKLPGLAAERNGPDLAQAAHNVAGSCAILGARQVQAAAIALELATRADNWPAVAAQVAVLQGAWIRLEAALAQYREP